VPLDLTGRRFKLLVTALIAATTFLGALGSWRATEAGGEARRAERKGVSDQRAAVLQETVIRAGMAATEWDYMRRTSLLAAASELRVQAEQAAADPDDLITLAAAYELAAFNQPIDPDALRPDGSLDLQAKFDLEWYAAGLRQDLDPAPEFALADAMRLKSERIVGITALFVAAALFLTLSEVSRNPRGRMLYFFGGLGVAVVAASLLAILELT
jgi:hypothetical protein